MQFQYKMNTNNHSRVDMEADAESLGVTKVIACRDGCVPMSWILIICRVSYDFIIFDKNK